MVACCGCECTGALASCAAPLVGLLAERYFGFDGTAARSADGRPWNTCFSLTLCLNNGSFTGLASHANNGLCTQWMQTSPRPRRLAMRCWSSCWFHGPSACSSTLVTVHGSQVIGGFTCASGSAWERLPMMLHKRGVAQVCITHTHGTGNALPGWKQPRQQAPVWRQTQSGSACGLVTVLTQR